jgi:hypothetical protein
MSSNHSVAINGGEVLDQYRGMQLRAKADRQSMRRIRFAPVLGIAIATSPDNRLVDNALAFASAYLHHTDYTDGKHGRESARLLGTDPPAESKALDHTADKRLFRWSMAGLAVRHARRGQFKRSGTIAAVGIGCAIRDHFNVQMRSQAEVEDINVGSRDIGRAKTALFALTQTLETSSLGAQETDVSQFLDHAMVGVAGLSVASHVDMSMHIAAEREARMLA